MIEQWIEELKSLASYPDTEMVHSRADQILCEALEYLGYSNLVDAWENLDKWYA